MANRVQEIGHRVYEVEGLGFRAQDVMILQGLRFVGGGGVDWYRPGTSDLQQQKRARARAHTHKDTQTKTHTDRHSDRD